MKSRAGFTLLEVMVSLIIVALATVALLRAGFLGAVQDRLAAGTEEAVARAQSRLASLGPLTVLRPGTLRGDDGGGYSWRLDVSPLQAGRHLTLYAVSLTIARGGRAVTLDTERLGPSR